MNAEIMESEVEGKGQKEENNAEEKEVTKE
jgi:hypothetical protein